MIWCAILAAAVSMQGALPTEPGPHGPPAYRDALRRAGISAHALNHLLARARATESDALVIVKDDRLVTAAWTPAGHEPVELMSVTKIFLSLAVGLVWDDGKIESLDQTVCDFFPEWKADPLKSRVTIRNILTHTSGIQSNPTTEEIYATRDFVKLALDATMSDAPGTRFSYNNKAANLLAGLVEKAAGRKLDDFLKQRLFTPMGITDFKWQRDPAGNPHGMAGLRMRATDLAKIGQLMLHRGIWNGKRLLSERYVTEATTDQFREHYATKNNRRLTAPEMGLLWWLKFDATCVIDDAMIEYWREHGVPESFISRARPLFNRRINRDNWYVEVAKVFPNRGEWDDNTWRKGIAACDMTFTLTEFSHEGYLGQYLVVVPRANLVAVRQFRGNSRKQQPEYVTQFDDFDECVRNLVAK